MLSNGNVLLSSRPFGGCWQNLRSNQGLLIRNKNWYSQAFDWGVPPLLAHPGSFKYGSSQRIMDCIEMSTYKGTIREFREMKREAVLVGVLIVQTPILGPTMSREATSKPYHPERRLFHILFIIAILEALTAYKLGLKRNFPPFVCGPL